MPQNENMVTELKIISQEVLQEACNLSKKQLNTVIDSILDQLAADPENETLKKARTSFCGDLSAPLRLIVLLRIGWAHFRKSHQEVHEEATARGRRP